MFPDHHSSQLLFNTCTHIVSIHLAFLLVGKRPCIVLVKVQRCVPVLFPEVSGLGMGLQLCMRTQLKNGVPQQWPTSVGSLVVKMLNICGPVH